MTSRKKYRAKYLDRMNGNWKTSLSGKRFGSLIAEKIAERYNERVYWLCNCDCGKQTVVQAADLKQLRVVACPNCIMRAAGIKQEAARLARRAIEVLKTREGARLES